MELGCRQLLSGQFGSMSRSCLVLELFKPDLCFPIDVWWSKINKAYVGSRSKHRSYSSKGTMWIWMHHYCSPNFFRSPCHFVNDLTYSHLLLLDEFGKGVLDVVDEIFLGGFLTLVLYLAFRIFCMEASILNITFRKVLFFFFIFLTFKISKFQYFKCWTVIKHFEFHFSFLNLNFPLGWHLGKRELWCGTMIMRVTREANGHTKNFKFS